MRRLLATLLPLLLAGCADRLLLYPSRQPIDADGAVRHLLPFDGGELEVFFARSPGSHDRRAAVIDLELIGNGSRAERTAAAAARRWGDRPVEVWAVNWPGYGGSSGPARLSAIAPAALAAYDAVADGRPVVVCGHSLGTAAALCVAARRPVAGLVLVNPPPLRQLILGEHGWWNLWLAARLVAAQVPDDLDSLANAARATAPAVFVCSGADAVVPPSYQGRVFDAYAGPKRLVEEPSADHNTIPEPATDQPFRDAIDWLWSRLAVHGSSGRDAL